MSVDDAEKLSGIVTRGDLLRALDKDSLGAMTVQKAGATHLVVTYPDELVSEAAAKMLRHDVGRLPVVDRANLIDKVVLEARNYYPKVRAAAEGREIQL